MRLVFTALTVLACSFPASAQERGLEIRRSAEQQVRVALVIGNATYEVAPLVNPVNDARAIAKTLRELGFDVTHKENADKAAMEDAIASFGGAIRGKSGVVLFYYAGHGIQVDGRNYLVPVNAKLSRENEVALRTIALDLVMMQLESARARTNVVILDACRNNPFNRSMRSVSGGLALMDAPSGTLIAYSTAPGSVADDGPGANGVYTEELLKVMRTAGLQLEEVFKRVRVAVQKRTEEKQRPWEASSLVGNFFFVAAETASAETRVDAKSETTASEKTGVSEKRSSGPRLNASNTSRKLREDLWEWTVFVEADPATLGLINCVEYTLHPTFPDPVRTICSPSNSFALSTQGWGTFEIKIRVLFKDGSDRRLTHQLRFE
jgi:caspase domain-containing protein/pYEATS domain-containing protein involved in immunity